MKNLLAVIGVFAIFPVLILYGSFSWGYVATVFQDWFILPIWPDFIKLTWWQYAGVSFFLGCFFKPSQMAIKKEFKDEGTIWAIAILGPWITLACGWIFTLFI